MIFPPLDILKILWFTFSDTHSALFSIQYKNGWLAASELFYMFTQLIKFYTFDYHVLRVQMFEKCDS